MSNREEIMDKIQKIFRDNFDDPMLVVKNDTSAMDIEEWDSFEQINLVVAMEAEFKIKFNLIEVEELKNVGDMVDLILRKLEI